MDSEKMSKSASQSQRSVKSSKQKSLKEFVDEESKHGMSQMSR